MVLENWGGRRKVQPWEKSKKPKANCFAWNWLYSDWRRKVWGGTK